MMTKAAVAKWTLFRERPLAYFLAAVLAGTFIGAGVLLAFTVGGYLAGEPYAKIVMGASFSVALSLVIMAGAELFTGNNMVLAAGALRHEVTPGAVGKVWLLCYLGNWAGSVLIACIYIATGLATGDVGQCMADAAATKMTVGAGGLLARGALCNFLVCLAVWCSFRCETESGKLIMVFWCIVAFFACGFEHSVANMTLLTIGLFLRSFQEAISVGGYFYNLLLVTLGNMIAGVLLALAYHVVAKENPAQTDRKS